METIFGTINGIERNECKPTEYYYRACDIDAFNDHCINCDKSHTRKIYELERVIKSLKNYRCAFYVMFAAWVILLIAYVLKQQWYGGNNKSIKDAAKRVYCSNHS